MRRIYEAIGKEKEEIIDIYNEMRAFDRAQANFLNLKDIIMLTRVESLPLDGIVNETWSINGINSNYVGAKDIIILEPLEKQFNIRIRHISTTKTEFEMPVKLSNKSIILMPLSKYEKIPKDSNLKNKMDIRLYEGKESLAIKMLLFDKGYIYLPINENGYVRTSLDMDTYIDKLINLQNELNNAQKNNLEGKYEVLQDDKDKEDTRVTREKNGNYKLITGLTEEKEGSIKIDNELYATTNIGKIRENQEDAVLLIKDSQFPDFKMMVIADGMGGWSNRRNCK